MIVTMAGLSWSRGNTGLWNMILEGIHIIVPWHILTIPVYPQPCTVFFDPLHERRASCGCAAFQQVIRVLNPRGPRTLFVMSMFIPLGINVFCYKFLFAVVLGVDAIWNLDLTTAMPHCSSSETRPKKRRKTVGFVSDPEGSPLFDNDNETRLESTEDTVETESAEAHFESH